VCVYISQHIPLRADTLYKTLVKGSVIAVKVLSLVIFLSHKMENDLEKLLF